MKLRILLVESDTEDVLFLRDVLEDMEGSEYWSGWLHLDIYDAPSWSFAKSILAEKRIDVVLLNLHLMDSDGTETYRKVQAAAPDLPIVLMIDEDVDTAERLMREGVQDFLVKKYIDCQPLAHALRNAVERSRLLAAARACSMTDPLTGLLNRVAFQRFADRDRRIAQMSGGRMAVLVAEPRNLHGGLENCSAQHRDLKLMEAADHLQSLAGSSDLIARIGENRFGISLLETREESIEEAWARFSNGRGSQTLAFGLAVLGSDRWRSLETLIEQAECDLVPLEAVAVSSGSPTLARVGASESLQ